MKEFDFRNDNSIIKVIYDDAVRDKKVYYKGAAYALKSVEEEITVKKMIFEFSFKRKFLSWNKIIDFKVYPMEQFEVGSNECCSFNEAKYRRTDTKIGSHSSRKKLKASKNMKIFHCCKSDIS